jgi:hypothetical protein
MSFMAKYCPVCQKKIGFFSGKFVGPKLLCSVCYNAYINDPSFKEEESEHSILHLSEYYANQAKKKKRWD